MDIDAICAVLNDLHFKNLEQRPPKLEARVMGTGCLTMNIDAICAVLNNLSERECGTTTLKFEANLMIWMGIGVRV